MTKFYHNTRAPNTCGVGVISMFRKNAGTPIDHHENPGGAGWLLAGFISDADSRASNGDDAACTKEAYEELKLKYKIRDQSPSRINDNSEHRFFYVMYDTKSTMGPITRAKHNAQFTWPL